MRKLAQIYHYVEPRIQETDKDLEVSNLLEYPKQNILRQSLTPKLAVSQTELVERTKAEILSDSEPKDAA